MKRFIAIITVLAILLSFSALSIGAKTAYEYGDVNKDISVSVTDATQIQLYLANMTELDSIAKKLADVDGDSSVTILDSTAIQMYLAALIEAFPVEGETATLPDMGTDGYYNQIVKP